MKGFTLIELAIVIVIAALLAAVAVPIYNGIVKDSKWSEGKTAVGSIKAVMDTFKAKTGGAYTGFTPGAFNQADNYELTRFDVGTLLDSQYFDEGDFFVYLSAAPAPGVTGIEYFIVLNAAGAAGGGQSGNGPGIGWISYDSASATWDDNYEDATGLPTAYPAAP